MIEDYEDVLYCEDEDFDSDRISKLLKLLTPISDATSSLAPIESAKLLAAWGMPEALDYFEYCIDSRIDKAGNLSPHRIHVSNDFSPTPVKPK